MCKFGIDLWKVLKSEGIFWTIQNRHFCTEGNEATLEVAAHRCECP